MIDDPVKKGLFFNAHKLFAYLVKGKVSFGKFVRLVQNPPRVARFIYPPVFYWFFGRGLRRRYGLSWSTLARYWFYSKV